VGDRPWEISQLPLHRHFSELELQRCPPEAVTSLAWTKITHVKVNVKRLILKNLVARPKQPFLGPILKLWIRGMEWLLLESAMLPINIITGSESIVNFLSLVA
jgi:hypothetical protein